MHDYLSAMNIGSDWFFLVPVHVTFWPIILCCLQTKTNGKCMLWQRNRTLLL